MLREMYYEAYHQIRWNLANMKNIKASSISLNRVYRYDPIYYVEFVWSVYLDGLMYKPTVLFDMARFGWDSNTGMPYSDVYWP